MKHLIKAGAILVLAVIGVISGPVAVSADIDDAVAHWKFDETEGTIATDASANINHGQVYGAAWQHVGGRWAGVLRFDGTDDYVSVPFTANSILNIPGDLTISVWVFQDEGTKGWVVIRTADDEPDDDMFRFYGLYCHGINNIIKFCYQHVDGKDIVEWVNVLIDEDGQWHHLAVVVRGEDAELYVDGIFKGARHIGQRLSESDVGDDIEPELLIGKRHNDPNSDFLFSGLIDDVRIYDRALSDDEVKVLRIPFTSGRGTAAEPFLISTPQELQFIGADPANWQFCFRLENDIDMSHYTGVGGAPSFNMIGDDTQPFWKTFDGAGHTISNLTITEMYGDNVGMFRSMGGMIRNLVLENPQINAANSDGVGALCGVTTDGTIRECTVVGGSVCGFSRVGGLVGSQQPDFEMDPGFECNIEYCSSNAVVSGGMMCGGLIGYNKGNIYYSQSEGIIEGEAEVGGLVGANIRLISCCFSKGNLISGNSVGGLVGRNEGALRDCYSDVDVTGSDGVGGLVGANVNGTITHCYSTGFVDGQTSTGGLVGASDKQFFGSYWDTQTSGLETSAVGCGKTSTEMRSSNTFAGWGGHGGWVLDEGEDTPRFAREGLPGESFLTEPPLAGSGTESDPYIITTPEQLATLGLYQDLMGKHFFLANDIDMSGFENIDGCSGHVPIGESVGCSYYYGVFDGGGHTISNLTITADNLNRPGLFGSVSGDQGRISNITLEDPVIEGTGTAYAGALASVVRDGEVTRCHVIRGTVSSNSAAGGLIGYCKGDRIIECSATDMHVEGKQYAGGLIGDTDHYNSQLNRSISSCKTSGTITGEGISGGLVGCNNPYSVSSCYSSAEVFGEEKAGGLIGENENLVDQCYSNGKVTGDSEVGGLVGSGEERRVLESYWDIDSSEQEGSAGGVGRSTTEMKERDTYIYWGCPGEAWTIDDGLDTPRLIWEDGSGESITCTFEGSGTLEDPYLIETGEGLYLIGQESVGWDKHFRLNRDIDMSAWNGVDMPVFTPVGNLHIPFTGTFDGNKKKISHLTIPGDGNEPDYTGLFGCVEGKNSGVFDLTLEYPEIGDGGNGNCIGAIAGQFHSGTIQCCKVVGGGVYGAYGVGGVVGNHLGGTVSRCSSSASISGVKRVGGLLGFCDLGGSIVDCYSRGDVSGDECVGGLVGSLWGYSDKPAPLRRCYSSNTVTGLAYVGGLVGHKLGSADWDSSWPVMASFWNASNGIEHEESSLGSGIPRSEMMKIETYLEAGWDIGQAEMIFYSVLGQASHREKVITHPASGFWKPDFMGSTSDIIIDYNIIDITRIYFPVWVLDTSKVFPYPYLNPRRRCN